MDNLATFSIIIGIYGAYLVGMFHFRSASSEGGHRPLPVATFVLFALVAIPSTLQFFFPVFLPLFERDRAQILAGEPWRLLTALCFQDGGLTGGIFNLVNLGLIGSLAERAWGPWRLLLFFLLGGLLSEIIALSWQPVGAGNSIANFSIAGGLIVWCLASRPRLSFLLLCLPCLGAYLALLTLRDIHGAAALIGLLLGLGLLWLDRQRIAQTRQAEK